jgi:hypothetical protein
MLRRALDILVAGAGLVVTSPVLAAAMIAIRLETPGHPIYRQRRVGLHGREFDVLKLRTMVDGAELIGAGMAVNAGDARITRVGKFLRRTSLDELPNLINILRGDMSLVGPRPTLPAQVAQYTERERGRLAVRPGLTGWAQVNGRAALAPLPAQAGLVHRGRRVLVALALLGLGRGPGRDQLLRPSSELVARQCALRRGAALPVGDRLEDLAGKATVDGFGDRGRPQRLEREPAEREVTGDGAKARRHDRSPISAANTGPTRDLRRRPRAGRAAPA